MKETTVIGAIAAMINANNMMAIARKQQEEYNEYLEEKHKREEMDELEDDECDK